MPFPVAAAVAAGGALVGQGIQMQGAKISNTKTYERTQKLMDKQQAMNQQMAMFNQEQQMKMWEATGPTGQMEQLKKAGLNPGLIYGMGGAGGQTAQAAQAAPVSGASYKHENPAQGTGVMGMMMGAQISKTGAEIELLKAQAEALKAKAGLDTAETPNRPKVGKNIDADTENKILNSVILKYTGKEAQAQYEEVKQPSRGIEAKTHQDEMEARQGIAGNIYELWKDGQLMNKSMAEIESLMLKNAQTSAETRRIVKTMDLIDAQTKGVGLDNILKDLDIQLERIGVGRNSQTAERILGRIFNELTGR